MPQAFYILFGAMFTGIVCVALGRILLRGLGLTLYREEEHPLAFVAGAACLSTIVFALAAAGLARKGVFLGVGAVILALAVRSGAHRAVGDRLPVLPRFWKILFVAVIVVFAFLYFFNAMAPEMSPDGSTYHLGLVGRYNRDHGFHRITTHMYANLSQGVEMLYLFAYAFGKHSAAALVHFLFLIGLPLAMLSYARRFGFSAAGVAGALFLFVSPVVGIDGSTAYNDVAVACILFALYYLVQIWDETRSARLFVPIGLLAGFGYAAKYTAFLGIPYALGYVGWKLHRSRKPFVRPAAVISLCALAMMAPWMAKNWIWLNNPFSPFFNAVFPNPYVHVSFEKDYAYHMRNYEGLASHWAIPLEVTVRGHVLCGLVGPLFLLAPISLFALRYRHGRRLLLAALIFGVTYATNIGTRFLIPALPYISLAMALPVTRVRGVAPVLIAAHAVLSWPAVLQTYCARYAWRLDRIDIAAAFRIESEDSFLREHWPSYRVARMIEERVPPGEKVLTYSQVAEAYTPREILVVYQAAFNAVLGEIIWTPLVADYMPVHRMEFQFAAEPLRRIRVVQTASGSGEEWSVSELRVRRGGKELARAPSWRLRAKPNPWDVQMAFDNSPVTRWRSWQALFSGMFMEVDFGQPEKVDSVVLECSRDQYDIALKLEGVDAAGKWKTVSEKPREYEVAPPMGLRQAASEEVKRAGVRYLLIYDDDWTADDFREKTDLWGTTLLAEEHGASLYRID